MPYVMTASKLNDADIVRSIITHILVRNVGVQLLVALGKDTD